MSYVKFFSHCSSSHWSIAMVIISINNYANHYCVILCYLFLSYLSVLFLYFIPLCVSLLCVHVSVCACDRKYLCAFVCACACRSGTVSTNFPRWYFLLNIEKQGKERIILTSCDKDLVSPRIQWSQLCSLDSYGRNLFEAILEKETRELLLKGESVP